MPLTSHCGIGKIPTRSSRGAISRDDSSLVGQEAQATTNVEASEEQDVTSHTRRRPAEVCCYVFPQMKGPGGECRSIPEQAGAVGADEVTTLIVSCPRYITLKIFS